MYSFGADFSLINLAADRPERKASESLRTLGDREYCRRWKLSLSVLITGSQENHLQLRAIISRFIASEGTTQLQWYFRQKKMYPSNYLLDENLVSTGGTWAGDVESWLLLVSYG